MQSVSNTDYSIPSRFFPEYIYDDCEFRARPQESDLQVHKDLMSAFRAFVDLYEETPINGNHYATALSDYSIFEMFREHIKKFFGTYLDVYCHRKNGPKPDCILRVPFRDVEGSTPEELFQANVSDILDFQTKCWDGNLNDRSTEDGIPRRLDTLKDIQAHALELDMDELESAVLAITGTCVSLYDIARSLAIGIHCRGATATNYKDIFSCMELRNTPEEWFKMLPVESKPVQPQLEAAFRSKSSTEVIICLPDPIRFACERWISLVQLTMHGLLEMQTHLMSKSGDLSWSLSVGDHCGPVYIKRCSIVIKLQHIIQAAKVLHFSFLLLFTFLDRTWYMSLG